jgi:hypothetical protein
VSVSAVARRRPSLPAVVAAPLRRSL